MILGIDEVGRGPWAGPLVVGAVVLGGIAIDGLTDSKKLTKRRREELDVIIRDKASGYGLGWVSANEIDEIGLSAALVLASKRAIEQINAPYHEIIIDGTINFLSGTNKGGYVKTLKKADLLIPSVSAASIIAKVARDNYMVDQDTAYPGYGFKTHVGYGTAAHREAIKRLGVTPLHRLSFAPLIKYSASKSSVRTDNKSNPMVQSTKQIGDSAEDSAVKYLKSHGHKIINRNWKTKFCEIDIVSTLGDVTYFTEVKYRQKPNQGGGLAAITPKKLRQMKFAAEYYTAINQSIDTNLRLAAISLTGVQPTVEVFLEIK
ncbi:MAG TPA: ribonuclease HII [Candidatus Saccharibacteria bacterium]|nr:ribonuclease HII [Candidatus Saccharibacteria bacterium]HRQ06643.1 ribonuclease HII [Candidatus Saccharibacteria bacterium]